MQRKYREKKYYCGEYLEAKSIAFFHFLLTFPKSNNHIPFVFGKAMIAERKVRSLQDAPDFQKKQTYLHNQQND